jgi:hypothetical protein
MGSNGDRHESPPMPPAGDRNGGGENEDQAPHIVVRAQLFRRYLGDGWVEVEPGIYDQREDGGNSPFV